MSITAIGRNFNGDPNVVTIVTNNTLTELITPGYWDLPETVASIASLQNGEWEWVSTDQVLINYSPLLNGFFTFDPINRCFIINTANQIAIPFPVPPTVTFLTPGDLSVAYSLQIGFYWRVGNLIFMRARLRFTPTYTTSSGLFLISNPLTVLPNGSVSGTLSADLPLAFPAGTTQVAAVAYANNNVIGLRALGNGVLENLTTTEFPTGVEQDLTVFVVFQV